MKPVLLFSLLTIVVIASLAEAQSNGGILISPGQPTLFVSPTFNGSANILRPGQSSLFFNPPLGGSTISRGAINRHTAFNCLHPLVSGLGNTPYGIVMLGHPSVLDKSLTPYGITPWNRPCPSQWAPVSNLRRIPAAYFSILGGSTSHHCDERLSHSSAKASA